MTPSDLPTSGCGRCMPKCILLVMYGWNESGGGTKLPRSIAVELVSRGYRVAVFYASLRQDYLFPPYSLEEHREDGVQLFGLFNRPALFIDADNPQREINDPAVMERFRQVLDIVRPELVHYHNFHGLTLAMAEETWHRRIPSCFSLHNYYMIDPELYLLKNGLELWGSVDPLAHSEAVARNPHLLEWYRRRIEITLQLMNKWVDLTLVSSRRQLELLEQYGAKSSRFLLIHQASRTSDELWSDKTFEQKHRNRNMGALSLGVIGGLMPIKGVHILVAAVQEFEPGEIEVHIHGTPVPGYREVLQSLDHKGHLRFHGEYSNDKLPEIVAGLDMAVVSSVIEDCAPLTVLELHAMRLPVIGARIGGIPDFISDGVDGILYAPYDIKGLAKIIRTLEENPNIAESMRGNISQPSQTFSGYCDRLEKVYAALVSGETADWSQYSLTIEPRSLRHIKENPSISWHGGLFVHHSLALVNRELCLSLLQRGLEISFSPTQPDEFSPTIDPRFPKLEACRNKPLPQIDVTVRHQWPPDFSPVSQGKLVLIQPWEFGSVPLEWVRQINRHVDELWVPSRFVRDCYLQGGVEPGKVQVVPNGVAIEYFHPAVAPYPLGTNKSFRFLFVGGTIHRKGIDVLLAAYSQAFSADNDVCLVIKDMGGNSIYQGQTAQEVITAFTKVPGHPEIIYLQEDFDNLQMASLYTACHCLVHPYRGEGFGLPIAEGMACGLAPLVTGYGAALDFCPPEIAWLIPATLQQLTTKTVGNLETVDFPWLAEPDVDSLADLMRHACQHPAEVQQRGLAAAAYIREQFSWDHAAQIAEQRLRQLVQQPENNSLNGAESCISSMSSYEPVHNSGQKNEDNVQKQLVQAACLKAEKLAQRGDVDAAVQTMLTEGIQVDPESPVPYLVLTRILLAANRFQEALGVVSEMPAATDQRLVQEIEAQCYCAQGDDDAARKAAQLAGEQSPLALVVLGTLAARQGNIGQGEELFRRAVTLDSGCGKGWLSLGMILWSQGKQQEAWQAIKQAVANDPLNAEAIRIMRDMAARIV